MLGSNLLKNTFTLLEALSLILNVSLKFFFTKKYKNTSCSNPARVTP